MNKKEIDPFMVNMWYRQILEAIEREPYIASLMLPLEPLPWRERLRWRTEEVWRRMRDAWAVLRHGAQLDD